MTDDERTKPAGRKIDPARSGDKTGGDRLSREMRDALRQYVRQQYGTMWERGDEGDRDADTRLTQ